MVTLWFHLAFIRHDIVCFVWFHAYVPSWWANNPNWRGDGWPSSLRWHWGEWIVSFLSHFKLEKILRLDIGVLQNFANYFLLTFLLLGVLAEAPDLKQEERLQELESCSGVGSTSDDTEVREVSSRPSTPGLSVVSGINLTQFLFFLSS